MGGVVDFFGGGGQTEVSNAVRNPALPNVANIDWNLGNQMNERRGQTYADFLAAQTAGMQPSIAQAQLRAATDQNLANQAAMAASARGGSAGTTQRLAMQNGANAGQQAAQQSAILAAQENQQNASNALGYQGMSDQFINSLYNLGNQRDLSLMNARMGGGIAAANIEEQGKNRNRAGVASFGDFLGNMGQGFGIFGTSGAGNPYAAPAPINVGGR